jgi:hypothetical protein
VTSRAAPAAATLPQIQRQPAIRFFEAVDRRDIRMVERGEDLRFAPEAREPVDIEGEDRREGLSGRRRG